MKLFATILLLTSYSLCTTCESNQFYDNPKSKCLICYESPVDPCRECDSISECQTCKEGYTLDGAKKCQKCQVKDCKDCSGD